MKQDQTEIFKKKHKRVCLRKNNGGAPFCIVYGVIIA